MTAYNNIDPQQENIFVDVAQNLICPGAPTKAKMTIARTNGGSKVIMELPMKRKRDFDEIYDMYELHVKSENYQETLPYDSYSSPHDAQLHMQNIENMKNLQLQKDGAANIKETSTPTSASAKKKLDFENM